MEVNYNFNFDSTNENPKIIILKSTINDYTRFNENAISVTKKLSLPNQMRAENDLRNKIIDEHFSLP